MEKKQKIKNKHYRQFLDEGLIETLSEKQIKAILDNIKGRNVSEGRAIVIALYYTGARPNEVLSLKSKDFTIKGSYLLVHLKGSKGGLPRTLYLPMRKPLVKELYNWAVRLPDDMFTFFNYRSYYRRVRQTLKGEKVTIEISDSLRYFLYKWSEPVISEGIPPYFLRHNRFSKLSQAGLSMQDLKMLKGSRTFSSVEAYLHLSTEAAKKIARKID